MLANIEPGHFHSVYFSYRRGQQWSSVLSSETSFPDVTVSFDESWTCGICFERPSAEGAWSTCGHKFCAECTVRWKLSDHQNHDRCPVCMYKSPWFLVCLESGNYGPELPTFRRAIDGILSDERERLGRKMRAVVVLHEKELEVACGPRQQYTVDEFNTGKVDTVYINASAYQNYRELDGTQCATTVILTSLSFWNDNLFRIISRTGQNHAEPIRVWHAKPI